MSLRDDQKQNTRGNILSTAVALVADGGEQAATIRAVAARAGVTERTVYRHFGSRRALLDTVSQMASYYIAPSQPPRTRSELVQKTRAKFRRFAEHREVVRAYLCSQSRGPRRRVDQARLQAVIECVGSAVELDGNTLWRRAAIADLVASPYALEWMQQFWGFSGAQAGEAAAEAIEILLSRRARPAARNRPTS